MKKLLALLMFIFAVVLISCGDDDEPNDNQVVDLTNAILTEDGYYDGGQLYYQIIDQNHYEARVSKAVKNCMVVTVPEKVKINGKVYTITEIGISAFEDRDELTSITLPNTLKRIAKRAFRECNKIESIVLPNSVLSIGHAAFADCPKINSITISESLTIIEDMAFDECLSLKNIYISNLEAWCHINYESRDAVFWSSYKHLLLNGKEIEDLVIPNSVKEIYAYTFYSCFSFKSITIPNSVTSIGKGAFGVVNNNNLKSITIPEKFKDEINEIFLGNLTNISITYTK